MAFQGSAEGSGATIETGPCPICQDEALGTFIQEQRFAGNGYRRSWHAAKAAGFLVGKHTVARHFQHSDRTMSAVFGIGDAQDNAEFEVNEDYFVRHGIQQPGEGWKIRAATVVERDEHGRIVAWPRVAPETEDEERIEIRQAEPVEIQCNFGPFESYSPSNWKTWGAIPDCQIGYWMDHEGQLHPTHDERCFDVGYQILHALAETEGLHGIVDVGDWLDLAFAGRWDPSNIDTAVPAVNRTWKRGAEDLAMRRHLVGPTGKVVVMGGNHTDRLRTFFSKHAPWIVGMVRPGEEETPVMSVPFMVRAADYDVEWVNNFPGSYRMLNANLVVMHSPALRSKPFDTAKSIASMIKASVLYGHTHRSERFSFNLETTEHGVRTFSVFSSGCWARIDGSLPSGKASYDDFGNRLTAGNMPANTGLLSANQHQGMDIIHVSDEGLWSNEHVEFWGGWAQWRKVEFRSRVDVEGNPL